MRALKTVPSMKQRLEAYRDLQSADVGLALLVKYYPWTRFDPRLAEILTQNLAKSWSKLNSADLNQRLKQTQWPQALGVILEQTGYLVSRRDQQRFRTWKKIAMTDIKPANGEIFWIGLHKFAGKIVQELPQRSIRPYLKWGYYGSDILINKSSSKKLNQTLLDKSQRMKILRQFAGTVHFFTVGDYMRALSYSVHKRTAELDLKNCDFIMSYGNTKARRYKFKS